MFEITYGQGLLEHPKSNRKIFLNNAINLIRLTKMRGIILSSETNRRVFMRSPLDVIQIG